MHRRHSENQGFTLIELSIVLVIIGLIVGGVLVGQDLISGAAVRAQAAQIEKYNAAVGAFRTKYNDLPGDMRATSATQFGFTARSGTSGLGDGNGIIQGYSYGSGMSQACQGGETLFFWEDLSQAGFVDGTFNTATNTANGVSGYSTNNFTPYFPAAKIGNGNFLYVFAGGDYNTTTSSGDGKNYFGLAGFGNGGGLIWNGLLYTSPSIPVAQAYAIDKKIDDGLPNSGNVKADLLYGWNSTNDGFGGLPFSVSPSSTSCVDVNGSFSNPIEYSMGYNNGAGVNCALTFQMQGAAGSGEFR